MSISPKVFLDEWSAKEFYDLSMYLAWEGKASRDYSEIMQQKNRKP